jgi:hypothetical protein
MSNPIELEIERRACERMIRIYETLGNSSGDIAAREDFGEFVRTIYIDLSKAIGYPKETPVNVPEPQFDRADAAPQLKVPPTDPAVIKEQVEKQTAASENKLTNVPKGIAYDKDKPGWNFCPLCFSTNINHVRASDQRKYQACFDDKVFLNAGSPTPVPFPKTPGGKT